MAQDVAEIEGEARSPRDCKQHSLNKQKALCWTLINPGRHPLSFRSLQSSWGDNPFILILESLYHVTSVGNT